MQFNPDTNKQVNEVIFSRKSDSANILHPPVKFNNNNNNNNNNNSITKCTCQKDLGILLDSKSNSISHVDEKIEKYKQIGLIRRLSVNLPRNALLTIYKSFIRPHHDCGDIFYDTPDNEKFQSKIGKVQYRTCLATTGAIQGASKEKIYDELGLHYIN